jgi:alkanesulfonate monooxygenase SsuD/methylene tetrahydromethanopterin reductase-like flavin-dependent oxidoreductase (luciferase family)
VTVAIVESDVGRTLGVVKLSTVVLPSERWPENRAKWLRAEELGFHAAYTYDHLSWRSFRERTWMSMVPLVAAVSEATSTIRLGPLVTSPNFRHPLLLAKDLITLDDVSGGRLTIGVGAGGRGFDAEVFGDAPWSNRERHERFVEFTTALDTLLRENASTIDGLFYPVVDSRQLPGPVQRPRPPLLVSALGPKSISFAAQIGDGWVCVGGLVESNMSTEDIVREQSNRLNDELGRFGRSGDVFERLFLDGFNDESPLTSFESFVDWAGRYHALGFTELVIHYPVADSPFDVDPSLFERIATEGREVIAAWH